jgi:predicted Zn-dependent peptidase
MTSSRFLRVFTLVAPICLCATASFAQDSFKEVQARISEFTLNNGWKFIVLERHQAPVASFYTYADVGSVQERIGITGLAHMFEHMAFKGSSRVGTKNYAEEKLSLDRVEHAFKALQLERDKGAKADPEKMKQLEATFKAAQETAGQFIVPNEFGRAISEAGGRNLNASTAWDRTDYFFDAPSNAMELWFYLESQRFSDPVFREFYKERDVVQEERRMRTDSSPIGKLVEEFLAVAYKAHPYGLPVVGHMSDLQNFTRQDAIDFFKTYYRPSNLTSVIVGDVDPKEVRRLADAYFGTIPSGPKPEPVRTVEPPQEFERRVTLKLNAQRIVLLGYHKPDINDPDNAVYDALGSVLSDGRSSRLNRSLVQDKKVSVNAFGQPGFPGQKYPNLFLFGAFVAPGKNNDEVEKAMLAEVDRVKSELVTADELSGVKNRTRAALIRNFNSNGSMAQELAVWQVLTGDWRNLFRYVDKVNAVTPQDIQRVAKLVFTEGNRTVGTIEPLQQVAATK